MTPPKQHRDVTETSSRHPRDISKALRKQDRDITQATQNRDRHITETRPDTTETWPRAWTFQFWSTIRRHTGHSYTGLPKGAQYTNSNWNLRFCLGTRSKCSSPKNQSTITKAKNSTATSTTQHPAITHSSSKHHSTITTHHGDFTDTCPRRHQHITERSPKHHQKTNKTTPKQHRDIIQKRQRQDRDTTETWTRHHRDITKTTPRHHGDKTKTRTRHDRDMTETSPRHHRDKTETTPKQHRDITQKRQRQDRDTTETSPRHHRDMTETSPRHHRDKTETTPKQHRDITKKRRRQDRDTTETWPRHHRDILSDFFSGACAAPGRLIHVRPQAYRYWVLGNKWQTSEMNANLRHVSLDHACHLLCCVTWPAMSRNAHTKTLTNMATVFAWHAKTDSGPLANNSLSCSWNNSYCALWAYVSCHVYSVCCFSNSQKKSKHRNALFSDSGELAVTSLSHSRASSPVKGIGEVSTYSATQLTCSTFPTGRLRPL